MAKERILRDLDRLKQTLQEGTDTAEGRAPSPDEFRKTLLIDADGKAVPFRPDPWQEEDFAALDGAWMQLAGYPVDGQPIRRAWQERPRGHSKTADLAVMSAWALAYASRPIRGIAAAASKDQAALLRDAIQTLVRLNPNLKDVLDVQSWSVINRSTGSQLDIMSSDVPTSYGQLPDFIVCDEVGHWPEGRGEELWGSLFSSAAKRAHCLLVVITNAGFMESWVYKVRESVREDPGWHFTHLDGPQASWISQDRLAEQQRILPPLVYDRLWLNIWSSGSGDALQPADIDAAVTMAGPAPAESGFEYWAGIDLAVSRDLSAMVCIGRHYTGRIKLARVMAWTPPKGGKIDLDLVAKAAVELHAIFRPKFMCDPYQCEMLAGQLLKKGLRVETVPFVGSALVEMASGLVEVFSSRRIDLYPDAALLSDLRRLRIVEGPSGWKLQAPRTAAGHCDRATALSLAVLGARRTPLDDEPDGALPFLLIPGRDPSGRDRQPWPPPSGPTGALGYGDSRELWRMLGL